MFEPDVVDVMMQAGMSKDDIKIKLPVVIMCLVHMAMLGNPQLIIRKGVGDGPINELGS